jgi:SHS2 domain-containing protein
MISIELIILVYEATFILGLIFGYQWRKLDEKRKKEKAINTEMLEDIYKRLLDKPFRLSEEQKELRRQFKIKTEGKK